MTTGSKITAPGTLPQPCRATRRPHEAVEAARTSTACNACRERKIKCSGSQPCRYCTRRQKECIFAGSTRKRLYAVSYVEDLERKIAGQASIDAACHPAATTPQPSGLCSLEEDQRSNKPSPLVPNPLMSSSLHFGSHIKTLSASGGSQSGFAVPSPREGESPSDAYSLMSRSGDDGSVGTPVPKWPSGSEAERFLETVLSSLGTVQHLLDPRGISDRLASMTDVGSRSSKEGSLLDEVECLLVFAIGQLLQGILPPDSALPGAYYFQIAVSRLPGFSVLRESGALGVEVMGLAAFYLQCADCKEDAYIYAGMALRLAIANGMIDDEAGKRIRPSERVHRIRLFWTIYMQERRLAAATGNPPGIQDEAIRAPQPVEAPGFQSVDALNVNVTIARITGDIIQDIYSLRYRSRTNHILDIQKALSHLQECQKCFPKHHLRDLSIPSSSASFSRTSATLHLMLFQARMLATRPVLLHVARLRLQSGETSAAATVPVATTCTDLSGDDGRSLLLHLCNVCTEAAEKTLSIAQTLRRQGILAKFGFFDLDAIFSTAFVFVLAEVAVRPQETNRSDGVGRQRIRGAASMMEYLSSCGNRVATKRLADIRQMCSYLDLDVDWREETDISAQFTAHQILGDDANAGTDMKLQAAETVGFDVVFGEDDIDLSSFWYGNDVGLDGTFETDWQEFERITTQI